MTSKPVIAVIDDDESILGAVTRLLAARGRCVQAFGSAAEFLAQIKPEAVCCVVCDLQLPGMSGLALQQVLQAGEWAPPFVFVTGYGDIPTTVDAMQAGAVDFLEKPLRVDKLLRAIERAVERGRRSQAAAAELARLTSRYGRLTPREREVFGLISVGLLNKQIAAQLGAAEKTVKQHRGAVNRKMEAESLAELVLMAERLGIRPTHANLDAARGRLPRPFAA